MLGFKYSFQQAYFFLPLLGLQPRGCCCRSAPRSGCASTRARPAWPRLCAPGPAPLGSAAPSQLLAAKQRCSLVRPRCALPGACRSVLVGPTSPTVATADTAAAADTAADTASPSIPQTPLSLRRAPPPAGRPEAGQPSGRFRVSRRPWATVSVKGRNRKGRCSSGLSDPARPSADRPVSAPSGSRTLGEQAVGRQSAASKLSVPGWSRRGCGSPCAHVAPKRLRCFHAARRVRALHLSLPLAYRISTGGAGHAFRSLPVPARGPTTYPLRHPGPGFSALP